MAKGVACSKIKEVLMTNNSQSRKWTLVINNPLEHKLNHNAISEILFKFSPTYFCMADEISTTETPHTHIFLYADSPIRFSTLKNRFPTAHIEKAYGKAQENREYIRKEGKWKNTEKAETIISDSFSEWGDIPKEAEEKYPQMYKVIEDIRNGMSTAEIIEKSPNLAFRVRDLENLRQTIMFEEFTTNNRNIFVTYLFGKSGSGKTSSIYKKHQAKSICRITSYSSSRGVLFDNYNNGQEVLVFEEFNSQIPIEDMLNYLDCYPLTLPARYSDRVAAYKFVYLTSNVPLEKQYKQVQINQPETWNAFLRRIHKVVEFKEDGIVIEYNSVEEYFDKAFIEIEDNGDMPF